MNREREKSNSLYFLVVVVVVGKRKKCFVTIDIQALLFSSFFSQDLNCLFNFVRFSFWFKAAWRFISLIIIVSLLQPVIDPTQRMTGSVTSSSLFTHMCIEQNSYLDTSTIV